MPEIVITLYAKEVKTPNSTFSVYPGTDKNVRPVNSCLSTSISLIQLFSVHDQFTNRSLLYIKPYKFQNIHVLRIYIDFQRGS